MMELSVDIFGRVQGVGFRRNILNSAKRLGVIGQVTNRSDGRVSVVAQGSRQILEQFLHAIQKGTFLSKISSISYAWKPVRLRFNDFTIMRNEGLIFDQQASFTQLGKHLLALDKSVPLHVAIIPDGNRRWATERGLLPAQGHARSSMKEHLIPLMEAGREMGIKHLTIWGFSTENWKRSTAEVKTVFNYIENSLKENRQFFIDKRIRFRQLGRKDRLPVSLANLIASLEKETSSFDEFSFNVCLDYGGRDELARAAVQLVKKGQREINERDIAEALDSSGLPDPDLIIRTSGEQRLSGFMPFQATYAELYFTDVYFPDFNVAELKKAVDEFARRKRNYGA